MPLQPVHRSTGDAIADRRFAYAVAAFTGADWQAAADLAAQTLELAPAFAPAHALLGRALAVLGRRDEAIAALQDALALDPEDELGVGVDLVRLGARDPTGAVSTGHVRALFDHYADGFETHLVETLHYRGPQIVRAALTRAAEASGRADAYGRTLDLGCGTGLMARALGPAAGPVFGVDLSQRMAQRARASGHYAEVADGEIIAFLDGQADTSADLVVAADVLIYIGDLFPLFCEVRRVLAPGGLFAFTVQHDAAAEAQAAGFALGVDGRFAHGERYLRAAAVAEDLSVLVLESCVIRQDRGLPVGGLVAVLGRDEAGSAPAPGRAA